MTDIDKLLEKARNSAAGYGVKRGLKEVADDRLKGVYASLYDDCSGTVAERDAWVKRQSRYKDAIVAKENAYASWAASDIFMKILFAEVEVWRSKNATARFIDRAHQ